MKPKQSNGVEVTVAGAESNSELQESLPAPVKKAVGINEPQTCKNKGCGQTFKEKDNHDAACSYHPGPAVFHDRMRGVSHLYSRHICFSVYFIVHNLIFTIKSSIKRASC